MDAGQFPELADEIRCEAETKLDPETRFDFVATPDIIGGNSGSPMIDKLTTD